MILFYAFSNPWATNISLRTLVKLEGCLKNYSGITFQRINGYPHQFFEEYIKNKSYSMIVGLGDIKTDDPRLRLETQANNRYGRHSILPMSPPQLKLDLPYIEQINYSIFTYGSDIGTYNCNWLAYRIQSYINQKKLSCFHLFFHLPLRSVGQHNAAALANLLITNQMVQ